MTLAGKYVSVCKEELRGLFACTGMINNERVCQKGVRSCVCMTRLTGSSSGKGPPERVLKEGLVAGTNATDEEKG
jgi:hypothetical protein